MDSDSKSLLLEVFLEAAEIDDSRARAAYLDGACGDNLELRQRVERLLAAEERAGGPPPEALSSAQINSDPSLGSRVGHYKLLQQIGEGGCGAVFMAEQEQPVRRKVALKVIKLGMDTKQVVARFEAERQALAMMDHPNIAQVFDAGATESGRPYFVMELVRGIKITDYCEQHQFSTRQRLDLFIQVCHAVQHAHQKGIIHRDLKPSNILVTELDGVPLPKIIDFGIAKAVEGRLTDQTLFTAFEQFIGTPAYMSPEQAALTVTDVDTRSDIYSLGVLLYELLTGQTPFDTKSLLAAGLDEMRRTIREVAPLRPSTRLRQTHPASDPAFSLVTRHLPLATDLDWIVMKCLEKDRKRRYETANGLAMDLKRHLNNEPVVARPPSRLYEFRKSVQRHKVGFAATAAIMLVLFAGVLVSTWQAVRATNAQHAAAAARHRADVERDNEAKLRRQAEANERKALIESSKNKQTAQFFSDMLASVGPSVAMGRDTTLMREILDKTAARMSNELAGQPEVEADLSGQLGWTYHKIGEYSKAEDMLRRAVALRRKESGNESAPLADSLNKLGVTLWRESKLTESENVQREALSIRRKLFGKDSAQAAESLNNLALVVFSRGKPAEAEGMLRKVLATRRKLLGNENADVAWTLFLLAMCEEDQGRFAEAETLLRETLAIRRNLYGQKHPDIAYGLSYLGNVLGEEGKLTEAESTLREALTMQKELLPEHHPDLTESEQALAWILEEEGEFAEAKGLIRESAAAGTASALNEAAWTLATSPYPEMRDGSNAVLFAEKAVAATSGTNAAFLETLAAAHAESGDFDLAVTVQKEAIALLPDGSTNSDSVLRLSLYQSSIPYRDHGVLAGNVYGLLLAGRFAEAEPKARACLALRKKLIPDDWHTFNAQSMLGGSLLGQKKYTEAEPLLVSGYEGLKQREDTIPARYRQIRLREALDRLVQLYQATGQTAKAAEWKKKLDESNSQSEH
jgi:eukaryotic-like serine/threonine-protein kinase